MPDEWPQTPHDDGEAPLSAGAGPISRVSPFGHDAVEPGEPHRRMAARAAKAGLRRIHVLGWRDLDDVEAGGSEVHAAMVARHWTAAGLWISMRTSNAQGRPAEVWRDGYLVSRKAGRYLVFPRSAASAVLRRSGQRDALVEVWNGMPFFSPVWDWGPKIVVVHHVHTEIWKMVLPPNLARVGDVVERVIAPPLYRRTPIVTVSDSTRDELVEQLHFDPRRVHVIPTGIAEQFSPGGAKDQTPLIVGVGRLVAMKRFELLIDAVAEVRRTRPDARLVIVGDGVERDRLETHIRRTGAQEWATLAGRISDEDLIDLYRRAWVVGSTSMREGWGMTLTEAAACGTPSVATRIGGHRDAVRDGVSGVLADIGDEFNGALLRVITDDDHRAALASGAIDRASELRWENTAEAMLGVLAEEAERKR
jgi:glycosyltransferase involved in cell wall biosynthesis